MKILLINAPVSVFNVHARLAPPLGLAYIGAALLDAGHRATAVDFNVSGLDLDRLSGIVEYEHPDIVGISAMTETYVNGLAIARRVKEVAPGTRTVMGGAHPTILPAEVLAEDVVDFVVVGGGEKTIVELAAFLEHGAGDPATILGLGYVGNGIHVNERRELPNPDDLPLPAWHLFPLGFYEDGYNVLTATGSCPYRCPFCSAASIWQGRRRARSPRGVVDELNVLTSEHGVREVFFGDDLFTLDKRWVRALLGELRTMEIPVRWRCSTRVDLVDDDLIAEMAAAGCIGIQYGVESGAQSILDSVKGIKKPKVMSAVAASVAAGISVACSFMVPFPDDTLETLRETCAFMREVQDAGAAIMLSFTCPYPGTYFHDHADELGIKVLADTWADYDAKHLIIETRNLTAAEIERAVAGIVRDLGMHRTVE